MNTLPEFDVLTGPFGQNDTQRPSFTNGTSNITLDKGIPGIYSSPKSNGGVVFTRHEMNEFGYLCTQAGFLDQIGYSYTFNTQLAQKIGGYPKGSILRYIQWKYNTSTGKDEISSVRDVISLVDDNMTDFTVSGPDGVNWDYCTPLKEFNLFPDWDSKTIVYQETITTGTSFHDITFDSSGWIVVSREIENWTSLTRSQVLNDTPEFEVSCTDPNNSSYFSYQKRFQGFCGPICTITLPVSEGQTLRVRWESVQNPTISTTMNITVTKLGWLS